MENSLFKLGLVGCRTYSASRSCYYYLIKAYDTQMSCSRITDFISLNTEWNYEMVNYKDSQQNASPPLSLQEPLTEVKQAILNVSY